MSISVVIPAYNAGRFIADAIESVRAQGTAIREIIVVDDGSTDDTSEIIAGLGSDIRYIRQENAGPSAARNLGIELASSPFVAFLDADDTWPANKTTEQMKVFDAYPEVGLVASDMAETDMTGKLITPSVLGTHNLLRGFQDLDGKPVPQALRRLVEKNFIPTGTVITKRRLLLALGGFKRGIRYGEDLELWARIACHVPIVCLPAVHMLRRQHDFNSSHATALMLKDLVKVMKSLRDSCGPELSRQGGDPDAIVSSALFNLAYWHFAAGNLQEARERFIESQAFQPAFKKAIYIAACHLPLPMLNALRRTKQYLG